jgi:hypothetical protein
MGTSASHRIKAAEITLLDEAEITGFLNWLLTPDTACPESLQQSFRYAVLQCTDSLVWGVFEADAWHWASDADVDRPASADGAPAQVGVRKPSLKTLLEARVFGQDATVPEVLIWRTDFDTVQFAGRLLGDTVEPLAADSPYRPLPREAAFLPTELDTHRPSRANRQRPDPNTAKLFVELDGGRFARRTTLDGRITVTPPGWAVALRDYPEEDEATGILRIALTRFVGLVPIAETDQL